MYCAKEMMITNINIVGNKHLISNEDISLKVKN
jgi:hypothetical protein